MNRILSLFISLTALTIFLVSFYTDIPLDGFLPYLLTFILIIAIANFIYQAFFKQKCPNCAHTMKKIPEEDIFPKFNSCPNCGYKSQLFNSDGPL